jgi:hypothetical protein
MTAAQTEKMFRGRPCRRGHDGLRYVISKGCVECRRLNCRDFRKKHGAAHTEYMREHTANWYRQNPEKKLWHGAKQRAAEKDIPFSITVEDIVITDRCPLLDIPLEVGVGKAIPNSPTLDRISNARGYVPGNVWVISNAANTCKGAHDAATILQLGVRLRLKENALVL